MKSHIKYSIISSQPAFFKYLRAAFTALVISAGGASAATYYIDYESGTDANNGTSPTTAFKHCPGDPVAEGKAKEAKFEPGDTIIFKGGVAYRGTVLAVSSGVEGKPIVYDGNTEGKFGKGKAIIDGSEVVTGWKPCASAAECGGNPNWKNIIYGWVPGSLDAFMANIFENDQMAIPAQDPNLKDFFYSDDCSTYRKVPPKQATQTTLTDPNFLNQPDPKAWDGAFISIWGGPNWVYNRKITSYDPAKHTITFEKIPPPSYPNKDVSYAMVNSLKCLDMPGEYVVSQEKDEQGRAKVYYWPLTPGDIAKKQITASTRSLGIDNNGKSFVTYQGFIVQKQSATVDAYGIYNKHTMPANNVEVRSNIVRWVRCQQISCSVNLSYVNKALVDHNEFLENPFCRGVLLYACDDSVISNNFARKCGCTGHAMWKCHRGKIINNTAVDNTSVHGNGMSVYEPSEDILVAGNRISNSNIAFTCGHGVKNLTVANNIFLGKSGYVFAVWGGSKDNGIKLFNNIIVLEGQPNNVSALCMAKDAINVVIKNNIISGSGANGAQEKPEQSNNIYTALCYIQKPGSLEPGAKLVQDLKALFVDPDKGDYHLKPGSPAIGAGVDVGLETDMAGAKLIKGKKPDIGPYKFGQ